MMNVQTQKQINSTYPMSEEAHAEAYSLLVMMLAGVKEEGESDSLYTIVRNGHDIGEVGTRWSDKNGGIECRTAMTLYTDMGHLAYTATRYGNKHEKEEDLELLNMNTILRALSLWMVLTGYVFPGRGRKIDDWKLFFDWNDCELISRV